MNERIRQLRKTLGLTMEKFGKSLGVGKTAISKIESGERNVTPQIQKAICREFKVDYLWLTTGTGEMFIDDDEDFYATIDTILAGENETRKNIIKLFTKLDDSHWNALEEIISLYEQIAKDNKKDQD